MIVVWLGDRGRQDSGELLTGFLGTFGYKYGRVDHLTKLRTVRLSVKPNLGVVYPRLSAYRLAASAAVINSTSSGLRLGILLQLTWSI